MTDPGDLAQSLAPVVWAVLVLAGVALVAKRRR
jgi:MYXO-CTERM domain-containing protein